MNNKKFAIGLFGIHYEKKLLHWMPDWITPVDYEIPYLKNKEIVYDNIKDISFYSSTYFSEKTYDLLNTIPFNKITLRKFENVKEPIIQDRWAKRNSRFLETIKLILDDNIQYDYVILQRYDIIFFENFLINKNLDSEKINVSCKIAPENINNCDDNLYILKYSLLEKFYLDLLKLDLRTYPHDYCQYISNINYLVDGYYYIHEIPIYKLYRCVYV